MVEKSDAENKSVESGAEATEFNGSFGFVIKPDAKTQRRAEDLAERLAPHAEFHVKIPHITLYHGRVQNLPLETVRRILPHLKGYIGETLALDSFEIYGGKFLFWDNQKTRNIREMHFRALALADYLDKGAVARAVDEGLSMTPEELENVRRFGHPLVRDRYTPHITLAYDSRGLTLPPGDMEMRPWEMKIEDVLFTEMGKYGAVARVVDLK